MDTGKIPDSILKKIVFSRLQSRRSEVIVRPGTGIDCSAVDFGGSICVLSSDPITGTAFEIGKLAVHINCNDIAAFGVEPLGLMITILCPPQASEKELGMIMDQLAEAAASINVDLLGGHTEVTSAVSRFVISCTAIGRCAKDRLITPAGASAGDYLVMTKHAGMEGASIIAHEKEEELAGAIGARLVNEAKNFINDISVVKDGITAAKHGAKAMHDATEGGILGAVWELCEASGKGAVIYEEKIAVKRSTRKICEYYNIDPFKLMSSGCMLIAAPDGSGLAERLRREGIEASVIGKLDDSGSRRIMTKKGAKEVMPPEADELYKVLS